MRRTLVVMLGLLVVLLAVAGCGDTTTTTETTAAPAETTTTAAPAETTTTTADTTASADSSWQAVQDRGELWVGLCAEYPPFESRNESTQQPEGFDVDLANALGEKLGVKVVVKDSAWEGLLGGILKGDYDVLITAMSREEAAAETVNMSDTYYDLSEVIVVKEDNTDIKSAQDLEGKIVGCQSGTSSEKAVDRLTGLKEVKRYNRNPEAFLDLRNGRSDAVVVGIAYAATEAKREAGLKVIDSPVATQELVFVSKAGGDALTEQLNKALAEVKADGTYDKLVETWLSVK